MFLLGWSIWGILLTLHMSACVLEVSGYVSHEVICSEGLLDCTIKDEMPLTGTKNNSVDFQILTAYFKLWHKNCPPCTLCLVIDIQPDIDMEDEVKSGLDEEHSSMKTMNPKVSVTVCYQTAITIPACKKIEFTVNHTALTQHNRAKLSIVITKPNGVSFESKVLVYSSKSPSLHQEVDAPSLKTVCSRELQEQVEEYHVPRLNPEINREKNQVELRFAVSNKSLPSVCVQYEQNGRCQKWNSTPIPLYSVTHCMCFQVWKENDQRSTRSQICPFNKIDLLFQENLWQNVSVSVGQGEMNNHHTMLLWNLSAPCRLEGDVWPCHKENSCREIKGFRQQLVNGKWRQNSKGQWETTGVFEDINLKRSPCVQVNIKGMGNKLGPFCFNNTDRWRWSLVVVGAMLLICLTMLIFHLLHDFVKKWAWSWHHGGFVKLGRKHHVVLLSPPDVDDSVSESVCRLGSWLCNQGFSVSVDQWSRKEQCSLGPLLWLHSQLLELKSHGGRVVLVLTHKALERAEEWTRKEVIKMTGDDEDLPQMLSPYSDVFTASLSLIQADKQLGRAGERFLLVKFDSHPRSDRSLPELLQGLPLLRLPSQTQALLTELSVGGTSMGLDRRTSTGWK